MVNASADEVILKASSPREAKTSIDCIVLWLYYRAQLTVPSLSYRYCYCFGLFKDKERERKR